MVVQPSSSSVVRKC